MLRIAKKVHPGQRIHLHQFPKDTFQLRQQLKEHYLQLQIINQLLNQWYKLHFQCQYLSRYQEKLPFDQADQLLEDSQLLIKFLRKKVKLAHPFSLMHGKLRNIFCPLYYLFYEEYQSKAIGTLNLTSFP